MKNLYMCLITVFLAVSSTSFSITTGDLFQQAGGEEPFRIITQETTGVYQLILDETVVGDQGMLILTDASGKVIFEEEVEILQGLVIQTFKRRDLQKLGAGTIQVELQAENKTYRATFTL